MVEDLDPLAAKLLEGNPLDLDEGMKLDIEVVFRNDLVVGDFSIAAGAGCDTRMLLIFKTFSL